MRLITHHIFQSMIIFYPPLACGALHPAALIAGTSGFNVRNPLLCAHFHLGLWLKFAFTVGGKKFPDPRNRKEWCGCPLWAPPNGRVPTYLTLWKPLGCATLYKPSHQFCKVQPV